MKQGVILFSLLLLFIPGQSQGSLDSLFQHVRLNKKGTGDFEIHITKDSPGERKPLLVYLDGSGNFPLYYRNKNGKLGSSLAFSVRSYAKDYRIVLISKPGILFYDSLSYTPSGRSYYPDNDQYREHYSLDWRAETASAAIDYVIKNYEVDMSQVIVMGYSEGSQVAPGVALLNKKVTHVVCFVGNALNQLYDFILEARMKARCGEITADEGQRIVDSLYAVYEAMYKDPASTSEGWYGTTYKKWVSFSNTTPLENMLQLNIPILYIGGGRDNNQTILDMDYAKLEFLRKGKTNLTYKVYPNCDHYFQEQTTINGVIKQEDRVDEVHRFAIDWTKSPGSR